MLLSIWLLLFVYLYTILMLIWLCSSKLAILAAWVVLFLVAYKTSQVELDWKEFDPYHELGIDRVSAIAYTLWYNDIM